MRILETEYEKIGRVTVCHIYAIWHGEHYISSAVAIRDPADRDEPEIGENLAWARAHAKLVKRVNRWTQGQITQADHNSKIVHKPLSEWEKEQAIRDAPSLREMTEALYVSIPTETNEKRTDSFGRRLVPRFARTSD